MSDDFEDLEGNVFLHELAEKLAREIDGLNWPTIKLARVLLAPIVMLETTDRALLDVLAEDRWDSVPGAVPILLDFLKTVQHNIESFTEANHLMTLYFHDVRRYNREHPDDPT